MQIEAHDAVTVCWVGRGEMARRTQSMERGAWRRDDVYNDVWNMVSGDWQAEGMLWNTQHDAWKSMRMRT